MNNRDIQIGNIVKTYNLCTGEITIDVINHIYRADKATYSNMGQVKRKMGI